VRSEDRPRALIFDFNGTLSDDEQIMYRVFADLFARHGRPLSEQAYLDELAGLSDEEIVRTWLGDRDDIAEIVAERIDRYIEAVAEADTVPADVRRGVLYAASRVPVLIVSGAAHAEIERVLAAAGLDAAVTAVISSDTVTDGKPHPEGYLAGVASAKAAGMRCIAVAGTLPSHRLAAADSIVPGIGERLIRDLLD
jgi:beta-phosphoglucomutase